MVTVEHNGSGFKVSEMVAKTLHEHGYLYRNAFKHDVYHPSDRDIYCSNSERTLKIVHFLATSLHDDKA